jgi:CheY-like chemotaxis protein
VRGTPVILASGYSDKATRAVSEGFALVRKPYAPQTLIQAINTAVGAARPLGKEAGLKFSYRPPIIP